MALAPARPRNNLSVLDTYAKLASVYDWLFGAPLQAGRAAAIRRLRLRPGDSVLEAGIGTALGASFYPDRCTVTGVDLSGPMLAKAFRRLTRLDIRNVTLVRVDAARLPFADESFDAVYAPYLMSVVADPVIVAREMHRVCRMGGRIVLLNHFLSRHPVLSWIERRCAPLLARCGFRPDLDMATFLTKAELAPLTIEKVNWPPLWSLLTCERTRP